jgi:hypothetical protein
MEMIGSTDHIGQFWTDAAGREVQGQIDNQVARNLHVTRQKTVAQNKEWFYLPRANK